MKSAQEIPEFYSSKIKQAKLPKEKDNAKALWDRTYDTLPEITKTEIKTILKQKAKTLLESQKELDKRISAASDRKTTA